MLTKAQVEQVARLARLGLTEKEKEKFRKELSKILDFVGQLQKAKTENIEPISQITGLTNVMREDKAKPRNQEQREKILDLAPAKRDKQFKVKAVF